MTYLSLLIGPSPAVRCGVCGVQVGVQEKLERWLIHWSIWSCPPRCLDAQRAALRNLAPMKFNNCVSRFG